MAGVFYIIALFSMMSIIGGVFVKLNKLYWKCDQEGCPDTLAAYTESTLEITKQLHISAHQHIRAAHDYVGHNDAHWLLTLKVDPYGKDTRSEDELKARYKR